MAPALETMREAGVKFPKGWNARSRCRPSWEDQKAEIGEKLASLEERAATKMKAKKKDVKIRLDWEKLKDVFDGGCGDAEMQIWEDEVRGWKKKWDEFVRSPIDKYTGEMAVM